MSKKTEDRPHWEHRKIGACDVWVFRMECLVGMVEGSRDTDDSKGYLARLGTWVVPHVVENSSNPGDRYHPTVGEAMDSVERLAIALAHEILNTLEEV